MSVLPLVPLEQLPEPFRTKVEHVGALGGDTSFFQYAANAAHMVDFYWGDFYQGVFFQGVVPRRVKQLLPLRLAAHSGCGFCQVGGPVPARRDGVSGEQIAAVVGLELERFAPAEQAALTLADHLAATAPPAPRSDEQLAALRRHFSD